MTEFKFYHEWHGDRYLELHDHHTIWEINKPFNECDYDDQVSICLWNLEQHFKDLKVYTLGRSGRHICVDDTPINRRRYKHLVSYAEKLEKWLIEYFNNFYDMNEEE